MNILILDTNRRETAAVAYHYTRLGHNVFYIKPYTTDLIDWPNTILWPILLTWAAEDDSKTNFEYHGYDKTKEFDYGEDNFLILEDFVEPISPKHLKVKLIDLDKDKVDIDVVHILPHFQGKWFNNINFMLGKYFPSAKVINSSFDPGNYEERITAYENACEFLPAMYENFPKEKYGIKNSVGFLRHPVEIELLGIDYSNHKDDWKSHKNIASFMHNFEVRQGKQAVDFFNGLSDLFKQHSVKIENFGGNIRGQGADLRYTGENGITGKYTTLSPRNSFIEFFKSRAILHLKSDDWAGGCEIGSRASGSPMIVFSHYYKYTNMKRTFGDIAGKVIMSADSGNDIVNAINYVLQDDNRETMGNLIYDNNKKLFNDNYWASWESFIGNLE